MDEEYRGCIGSGVRFVGVVLGLAAAAACGNAMGPTNSGAAGFAGAVLATGVTGLCNFVGWGIRGKAHTHAE